MDELELDNQVKRNRVKLRFHSPVTRVKDVIRVPSKKSLIYELCGLRLALRTRQLNMHTIDEYDDNEEGDDDCFDVGNGSGQEQLLGWLTDDVFSYNPPTELNERHVEVLLDVFLKLGFKKLVAAPIQPQL